MTRPSRRRRVCWVSSRDKDPPRARRSARPFGASLSLPPGSPTGNTSSFEGRALFHAIVSSETVITRLEQAEGAKEDGSEGERGEVQAGARTPVVLWIGAAAHGDEPSGADAALALLYHLAADRSESTRVLLDNVLVVIDPLQNPDGRARFLAEHAQWTASVANLDYQSVQHRGSWPGARGNHYFIDLNRDWFALTQPESRARAQVLLHYHPQVTLDLHEMSGFDSYLISPPREPFHPDLPASVHRWWDRFSRNQALAFGERGWTCYTRDWHEEFNPTGGPVGRSISGRSDSWPSRPAWTVRLCAFRAGRSFALRMRSTGSS